MKWFKQWFWYGMMWCFGSILCLPYVVFSQTKPEPIRMALIEVFSGPLANTGEAVWRNVQMAVEEINARGGVMLPSGRHTLQIIRFDSKGQTEEALAHLRAASGQGIQIILQGNSSAIALALSDAVAKYNDRYPQKELLYLNYSAVDPQLTNEKCNPWHFRFDAHADMRLNALMSVIKEDQSLKQLYLIGQDYSFGQAVLASARKMLPQIRPDVRVVGDELHPMAKIKDFMPYANKIKASGAQAVLTGNWGHDLTGLIKAAREVGFDGRFYTFYGNALGAPAAIGEAGIGKVVAVAEWFPNMGGGVSDAFYQQFRQRYPKSQDDYVHLRMHMMIQLLAKSIEKAASNLSKNETTLSMKRVAQALSHASVTLAGQTATMRPQDHQIQQPLAVAVMDKQGRSGVKFDVEGSGYGFRVIRTYTARQAEMGHTCRMKGF